MLGIEPVSPGKTASALNHQALSQTREGTVNVSENCWDISVSI